jgi:chorismate synthase
MRAEVDAVLRTGDSLGGVFEIVAHRVPPGLGTVANWDERLDTKLAAAVMSIQAVKAVEIGEGMAAAFLPGSQVHDTIGWKNTHRSGSEQVENSTCTAGFTGFTRRSNRAGGLEGGISNGEDIVVRGYLKPIATLRRPLESVDFETREPVSAAYERSDVCVVPAAGVVGEAMVALVLAGAVIDKFGGDSLTELLRNFQGYCEQLHNY